MKKENEWLYYQHKDDSVVQSAVQNMKQGQRSRTGDPNLHDSNRNNPKQIIMRAQYDKKRKGKAL